VIYQKINPKNIKDFDLMTYGFPCQDITAMGNQKGLFDENGKLTRSGLFFEAVKIAKEKQPLFLLAENVKALTTKTFENDFPKMIKLLDDIGYNTYWKVLNSKDYGIPHSRQRVYIMSIRKDIDRGFEFPNAIVSNKKAKDFYEKIEVGNEYYLRESDMKYLTEFRLKKKYSSLNADTIVCQTTKQGNLANPQNFIKDQKGYRIMTPSELLSLQGFKSEYGELLLSNGITKEQIGYMSGNSITVNVLTEIFKKLIEIYPEYTQYIRTLSLFSGLGAFEEALKNISKA
jgi:site-specific DNA-cytosine methylase